MAFIAVIGLIGTAISGASAYGAGKAKKNAADAEADQMLVNAGQARAYAQRAAAEERRQGELVQSRAIALAAASGGSITDPGIVTLLASNAGETAYRSSVALYKGEEDARRGITESDATQYGGRMDAQDGKNRAIASGVSAFGDLVGMSLKSKYGDEELD